jgi:hypothetical protein
MTEGIIIVDIETLSKKLGISTRQVQRFANSGKAVKVSKGKYDLNASLQNFKKEELSQKEESKIEINEEENNISSKDEKNISLKELEDESRIFLNLSQLSSFLNFPRSSLRSMTEKGQFPDKNEKGLYNLKECVKAFIKYKLADLNTI